MVVADIDESGGRQTVEHGGSAMFRRCDVTKSEDLDSTFDWARIISIDLTAVVDATRLAVRNMRLAGTGGSIVNTASLIGLGPMASAPVYAAAKAGVVNFSRSLECLAGESNIRVNTIRPELVDTPLARALGGGTGRATDDGQDPQSRRDRGGRDRVDRG